MQTFSSAYDYDNDNNVMLCVNLIIMILAILRIYAICSAVTLGKAKWLLQIMSEPGDCIIPTAHVFFSFLRS